MEAGKKWQHLQCFLPSESGKSETSDDIGVNQSFSNYFKYQVVFFFSFYFDFLFVLDQYDILLTVPSTTA